MKKALLLPGADPKIIIRFIFLILIVPLTVCPANLSASEPLKTEAKTLNSQAEEMLNGDLDLAITMAKKALEKSVTEKNPQEKARAQKLIADAYYYKNEYLKAIDWYQASAETEKQINGEKSAGYQNRVGDVGFCYMKLSLYDKADEYYLESLQIARIRLDSLEIASNLNNLGNTAFARGDYPEAIAYFDQTLQLDKLRKSKADISSDLNNIGKVYLVWKKYDKALEYYHEALQMAIEAGNKDMQAIRLSNIGQALELKGDFNKALDFVNQALELDIKLGNTAKTGIRYSHLGLIYLKTGDYKKSFDNLSKSLTIFEATNNTQSKVITLNHLGSLMMKQLDFEQALNYFSEAFTLANKYSIKSEEMRALKNMSDSYESQGKAAEALKYYKQYASIKDSIFNEEKHRQIAEFEARYETEKKEKENKLLRQEAQIQKKQNTIFILSGSAALLLALSFMILFSMKRKSLIQNRILHEKENQLHKLELEKKEKENQHLQDVLFAEEQINRLQTEKLQQKNRELSTSTVHILNKNEVLGNIRKMATEWMKADDFDKTKNLKKLIREVDHNTDLDEQWEQFKLHFESVHKGFFERLLQKFPNITQNELKLCAYLRMNLSTKEIAQMLNISPESVTTKRYRLRKKLGLEKDDNLVGFIGGF
jgi:tetratricopeptide (TPR) repeat protein